MKSTLFNMVTVLFVITLIASAGVGVVNMITEEPISLSKQKAVEEALKQVLPAFDATTDEMFDDLGGLPAKVYTATQAGEVVGYAVETSTSQGFNGTIRVMVGFNPAGEIYQINVLEQAETPGLGTKMCDEGNPLLASFFDADGRGKRPGDMKLSVTKDGGEVDGLTAATISSRAYVDAVSRAWQAYLKKNGVESDAASGATAAGDAASGATTPGDAASGATVTTDAAADNQPIESEKGGENEQ